MRYLNSLKSLTQRTCSSVGNLDLSKVIFSYLERRTLIEHNEVHTVAHAEKRVNIDRTRLNCNELAVDDNLYRISSLSSMISSESYTIYIYI